MPSLTIAYVFEGHQRGYNFIGSTAGMSDDELRLIWRQAMPRGTGWGQYIGARVLKCFPVQDHMAVCVTHVTDLTDEHGRGGIRHTDIDLLTYDNYRERLQNWLEDLPVDTLAQAHQRLGRLQRLKIANATLPRPRREQQLAMVKAYGGLDDWQIVEALVILLALNPVGPMRRWGGILSLTTLTLNPQEESIIVGVPQAKQALVGRHTATFKLM